MFPGNEDSAKRDIIKKSMSSTNKPDERSEKKNILFVEVPELFEKV